nr:MAG: RNA dependent RNA polymerase [Picornaviridae sp.]
MMLSSNRFNVAARLRLQEASAFAALTEVYTKVITLCGYLGNFYNDSIVRPGRAFGHWLDGGFHRRNLLPIELSFLEILVFAMFLGSWLFECDPHKKTAYIEQFSIALLERAFTLYPFDKIVQVFWRFLLFLTAVLAHFSFNTQVAQVIPLADFVERQSVESRKVKKKTKNMRLRKKVSSKSYQDYYPAFFTTNSVKLYGITYLGDELFAFPSQCSVRTLVNFLMELESDKESYHKLTHFGVLEHKWKTSYLQVYPPVGFKRNARPLGKYIQEEHHDLMNHVATFLHIAKAFVDRDMVALGLIALQHTRDIENVAVFMGLQKDSVIDEILDFLHDASTSVDYYFPQDDSSHTDQGQPLGAEMAMNVLPPGIRHSNLIQKVILLVAFFATANLTNDSAIASDVVSRLNLRNIAETTVGVVLIGQVLREVYRVFRRYLDGEELLGLSKDVQFLRKCEELVIKETVSLSPSELDDRIEDLNALLRSRENLRDTSEISRMKDRVREKRNELQNVRIANTERVPPVVFFIAGPPGLGKTTLVNSLMNKLAKVSGFERKLGDAIYYKMDDKFPVEASPRSDAAFLVMNDIKSDFSGDLKQGLPSFDAMLQQIVDSTPLQFPQAFDKGKIFYGLKFVIITSNNEKFLMTGDSEKLVRRFSAGYCCRLTVEGNLDAMQLKKLDVSARNQLVRFTPLRPNSMNKQFFFEVKQNEPVLTSYAEFFGTVSSVLYHNLKENASSLRMFSEDLCACGIARAYHACKGEMVRMCDACDVEGVVEYTPFVPESEKIATTVVVTRCINFVSRKYAINSVDSTAVLNIMASWSIEELKKLPSDVLDEFVETCRTFNLHEEVVDELLSSGDVEEKSADPLGLITSDSAHLLTWYDCMFSWVILFLYWGGLIWVFWQTLNQIRHFFDSFVDYTSPIIYTYTISCAKMQVVRRVRWRWFQVKRDFLLATEPVHRFAFALKEFFRKYAVVIGLVLGSSLAYMAFLQSQSKALGPSPVLKNNTYVPTGRLDRNGPMWIETSQKQRSWASTTPMRHAVVNTLGVDSEDLSEIVRRNFLFGEAKIGTKVAKVVALGVDGHTIAINRHYVEGVTGVFPEEGTSLTLDGVSALIKKDDCTFVEGTEIVYIHNSFRAEMRDLKKFISPVEVPYLSGTMVYPTENKPVADFFRSSAGFSFNNLVYPSYATFYDGQPGDCGSILLGHTGGNSYICGMLFAKDESLSMNWNFKKTRTHFTDFILPPPRLSYPPPNEILVDRVPANLGPISNISELACHQTSNMQPLGTAPGATASFSSAYRKTKVYDSFAPYLTKEFKPPTKIGGMVDGVYTSAWTTTYKRFHMQNDLSDSVLFKCAESYVRDVMKNAKSAELRPLTFEEALFGHSESFVDKTKLDTSAGPFWKDNYGVRTKKDLFYEEDGRNYIHPDFLSEFSLLEERFLAGDLVAPICHFVPKDEVREATKIDGFKIRLFGVHDADYNLLIRKYCMPIISFLLMNKEASECFGQMNAASQEWTNLVRFLEEVGPNFSDLDFSSFDTSHTLKMFRAVALIFFLLAQSLGYTYDEAKVTAWCIESIALQVGKYKSDYFIKRKGMSSGVIVTLILNSLINSTLMRAAFFYLVNYDIDRFREFVRLATVGDDNVNSIHSEILPKFNMVKIAPLYEAWGYTVTPASKSGEFVTKMELSDLTFLKRRFVLWPDGFYRAPIDTDSIYKAMCFERKDGVSGLERLIAVYQSALREAYLHGEGFFNRFLVTCREVFADIDLPEKTFSELNSLFLKEGITTDFA